MSAGGRSAIVPIQLPAGADPSSATGSFFIFSNGGTTNVTVQVLAANGISVKQGTVSVSGTVPGNTSSLFASVFDLTPLGMVKFSASDLVNIQVVFKLQAQTPFASIDTTLNYASSDLSDGQQFFIAPQPASPQYVVSNPNSSAIQVQPQGGVVVTVGAASTVALPIGSNPYVALRVVSGVGAAVSYAGSSVPAIG